jgi:hypothetical protein
MSITGSSKLFLSSTIFDWNVAHEPRVLHKIHASPIYSLCSDHPISIRRRAQIMEFVVMNCPLFFCCFLSFESKYEHCAASAPCLQTPEIYGFLLGLVAKLHTRTKEASNMLQALRFSRQWLWRMSFSGMWRRVDLVWTDVSENRIA